ncbi:MAG: RsiV family protein [Legionella sp.]|uniref:RsiV family protein n=1 Tax=Legionella sp. TaxID=459 RepID=UPI0039E49959
MMNQFKTILSVCLIVCALTVQAVTPVALKKETANYILDVNYPQGFKDANVNTVVKDFIEYTEKNFYSEIAKEDDVGADVSGKSGLNIIYSIAYQQNNALSIRFNVSIYHRGAVHPLNTVSVLNFINGRQVKLADLFVPGADYLKPISKISNKKISAKNISDAQWIQEGTKPIAENYHNWLFTPHGLAIIFDSYQVAAYVYGAQTVLIPLSAMSRLVKPELLNTVWKKP